MDPITLMAIAQGAVGLGQLIGGFAKKKKRPTYEIPDAVRQATNLARIRSTSDMPGLSDVQDLIGTSTANAITNAASSGDVTQALAGISAGQNKSLIELGVQNATYQDNATKSYMDALNNLGRYQDQEFQINEFAPFAEKAQERRDQFGAGLENIIGAGQSYGLSQLAGAAGLMRESVSETIADAATKSAGKLNIAEFLDKLLGNLFD